jgi:hypothetical protein
MSNDIKKDYNLEGDDYLAGIELCPFCGSNMATVVSIYSPMLKRAYIQCPCGASGPQVDCDDKPATTKVELEKAAKDKWNKRGMVL